MEKMGTGVQLDIGMEALSLAPAGQTTNQLEVSLNTNPHYFPAWGAQIFGEGERDSWMAKDVYCLDSLPRTREDINGTELHVNKSGQRAVLYFVEAFTFIPNANAKQEEGQEAEDWVERAMENIKTGLLYLERITGLGWDKDYAGGIYFLVKWTKLAIFLECQRKGESYPEGIILHDEYNGQKDFDTLADKGKALVFAAKLKYLDGFWKKNDHARELSTETLKQLVKYDPRAFEWHYSLGNSLRCTRRMEWKSNGSEPSLEEIEVLWETYEDCDYEKFDAGDPTKNSKARNKGLAGVCQAIAEVVRFRLQNKIGISPNSPFIFGKLEFTTPAEMVSFVTSNVNKMMTETVPSYAQLIRSGEIFSSILPFQFRKYADAEKYLLKAEQKKPQISKIHHKLGSLYCVSDELRDKDKAIKYFKKALEIEEGNFPACIDLINCYLCSPDEHKTEIEDLVTISLSATRPRTLSNKDKQQLEFSHGCLDFLTGDMMGSIKKWITAFDLNPTDIFAGLASTSKRFKWSERIDMREVKSEMEDFLRSKKLTESENESLSKMLALKSISGDRYRSNYYNRGRTQGFGQRNATNQNWRSDENEPRTIFSRPIPR